MEANIKKIVFFYPENKSPCHFLNKCSFHFFNSFLVNTRHAKSR